MLLDWSLFKKYSQFFLQNIWIRESLRYWSYADRTAPVNYVTPWFTVPTPAQNQDVKLIIIETNYKSLITIEPATRRERKAGNEKSNKKRKRKRKGEEKKERREGRKEGEGEIMLQLVLCWVISMSNTCFILSPNTVICIFFLFLHALAEKK